MRKLQKIWRPAIETYPIVAVHLDLKYLMPRKDYLLRWVARLPELGVNTLVLEYEDKFPYQRYPFLQAEGAFTPAELARFLATARGAGVRVIPLVQTISHLEFALAHPQLAHLREMPDIPTQLDTSNPQAVTFVKDMVDEVLAYHEQDEMVHLGADEAWHLGRSPRHADRLKQLGPIGMWAEHVVPIVEHALQRGKRPIVWDDTFWPDPAKVSQVGLPRQTILASWHYGVTPENVAHKLHRVQVYRAAGFDVLGAPCHDWGVLTPMHDHNLANTAAWAIKARQADLMGLINTAWAVFHTLLPTETLYAAATAQALRGDQPDLGDTWQRSFLQREFGVDDPEMPQALLDLGANWEQQVGLERGITPVVYGYMDMLLHYGSQAQRMAQGVYPLDWSGIDFDGIYRKKVDLLRDADDAAIEQKLRSLGEGYQRAGATLHQLASAATARRDEAALLAVYADLKLAHTRLLEYHLYGRGDRKALRRELAALGPRLEKCLSPFAEPVSVERLLRLWLAPAAASLS